MKKMIICLLAFLPIRLLAGDYVEVINTALVKNEEGRRVIYEMNVGMFTKEGTLRAASRQLDELKKLGVDVVWLMPVYPRGGGINSPYAATDFKQVNPSYGTVSDLRDFVARAHEMNLEVWLDWVPNHTATDAKWVTSHPEYYVKKGNGFVHPNNYGDVYQLDYNNGDLRKAMNDCMKMWIDEADVDGFRCDYISSREIPASYWQTTIPEIKSYKSGKTITFLGEADIAGDASRLKTAGFDYDYAWGFQSALARYGGSGVYSASLRANIDKIVSAQGDIDFGRMVYLTNHDQNYNEAKKTLSQKYGENRYPLTVLIATAWGMPLIYNGQETGGDQVLDYFHDTKIDWSDRDEKMYNTWRTLAALKHAVAAFQDGRTTETHHTLIWHEVKNSQNVLAYTCRYGESEALVVLNFGTEAVDAIVSGITEGDWSRWLDSRTISKGVSRKQVILNATHQFSLEAKGYRVYVRGIYQEEDLEGTGIIPITNNQYPIEKTKGDRNGSFKRKPGSEGTYSLSGQRIKHGYRTGRGIYIRDGKKRMAI